jgi:hypothetical protein
MNNFNPAIVGQPREVTVAEIVKRLGLPTILRYAFEWTTNGIDLRTAKEVDIPMLSICCAALQSGFVNSYAVGKLTTAILEVRHTGLIQ